MISAGIVLFQLIILFFLSKHLKNTIFLFFYSLTKSQNWSVSLFSLLFFPGTVVHELSHFAAAAILLVGVKNMELVPTVKDGRIRSGSVQIAKTDFVRRTIIGTAPVFVGITIIWLVFSYFVFNNEIMTQLSNMSISQLLFTIYDLRFTDFTIYDLLFTIYFIFSISNMMYSSRKDLESLIYLIPFLILVAAILYLAGFNFALIKVFVENLSQFFTSLNYLLGMVITVNTVILTFFLLLVKTTK